MLSEEKWTKLVSGLNVLLINPSDYLHTDYGFKVICLNSYKTPETQAI